MDLKKLGMTELIAFHNQLAESLGVATETSFKSLGAARNAITTLQSKGTTPMSDETTAVAVETPAADAAPVATVATDESQKYNSSGKRGPNQGVGAFAKEQILAGKNNADALKAVLAQFPNAKTTTGCIAFYRTALSKTPGGVDPDKLRADAEKLIAQAASIEVARKAAADAKAAAEAAAPVAAEAAPM
tara:strand:- start:14291 stop:14857 length:567 start_codon:yes stop_codon:yes gene_type:complete